MIAIGSDHGGFELKAEIINYLTCAGLEYKDFGVLSLSSVDYPDIGYDVAKAVTSGACEKGILICGTGIGISIAANKVAGIRAALCTNSYMAKMSRLHNDSNILALGGRVVAAGLAVDIVKAWLETAFEGGRHEIRIDKINQIEKNFSNK